MKPNDETIEAYKKMAKESSGADMKAQIQENLSRTCDKFAGNEDKLDRCIRYLTYCAREIIDSKNGLKVYVPQNVSAVIEQAKKLHQCLISSDYVGKMTIGKCLLVFIAKKSGKPVATAEILKNGEIGQFYGDESKPYNEMKPNEKTTEALHAWMEKNKEKAMKVFKGAA